MRAEEILRENEALPREQRWSVLEAIRRLVEPEIPASFKEGMEQTERPTAYGVNPHCRKAKLIYKYMVSRIVPVSWQRKGNECARKPFKSRNNYQPPPRAAVSNRRKERRNEQRQHEPHSARGGQN